MNLVHVWHEHRGFRKCAILNNAIRVARGDYLAFTDGDCIPRKDFVETHLSLARPGRFLSGGMIRLPQNVCHRIDRQAIDTGNAFSLRWLIHHGLPLSRQVHRLTLRGRCAKWADLCTTTHPTFNGHNASVWKHDIEAVNGFDERMRYGGLDRELGERLENNGIRGLQIRHRAICVHLDHLRPYRDPAAMAENLRIRKATVSNKKTWTDSGLVQAAPSSLNTSFVLSTKLTHHREFSSCNMRLMELKESVPINSEFK